MSGPRRGRSLSESELIAIPFNIVCEFWAACGFAIWQKLKLLSKLIYLLLWNILRKKNYSQKAKQIPQELVHKYVDYRIS